MFFMKKYLYTIALITLPILFGSCLKDGLDDVEYSTECEVTSVSFEHRWVVESEAKGVYTLYFKTLTVNRSIDSERQTITVDITVPNTDKNFIQAERDKVSLSSLACLFVVSNAASVTPLDGAPKLGVLGDFSAKRFRYRVTSASGKYKDWELQINNFTK